MLCTEIGVLLVSKVEELVDNIEVNYWKKKKKRTTPIVAFDHSFLTQENADMLPILICRGSRHGQMGVTCCERKGPTAYSISLLVGFIKDLGFRRIILKCDKEPSTKSHQNAVIQACAGVEVIPQGPPEAWTTVVREMKRQCRTFRISAEQNKSVLTK